MNQFNHSLMRISFAAIVILGIALIILGCQGEKGEPGYPGAQGPNGPTYPSYYDNFDPDLQPMALRYERHLGKSISRLNSLELVPQIKVYDNKGNLITSVIGVCFRSSKSNRVEIESDYWWGAHRVQAESLGFHELAHCIQLRPHNNIVTDNCPSIMNSYIGGSATFIRCWDTMIKELFKPASSLSLDNYSDDCYLQPNGDTACVIQGESNDNIRHDPNLLLN